METKPAKIYIVACEPSGDILAARLMSALRGRLPSAEFYGIGGETMTALGFEPLFDISDTAVMGIWEVLPRLPLILKRLRQTAAHIEQVRPDVLITVDSWGFVHNLLKRLEKKGAGIPKIHYVAPQVWAWKRGRAKTAARLIDELLTILPHEAPYFEKHGLHCTFVGHPAVEIAARTADPADFRRRHNIPPRSVLLCLLPGSRRNEIRRLAPIFREVAERLKEHYPNLFVVIPSVESMAEAISAAFACNPVPHCVVTGQDERYRAFCACGYALAASGTVSLELACCGVPQVVAYRFGRVSNLLAEVLVRPHTPFGNLINILLGSEVVPECMLADCTADFIFPRLLALMQSADLQFQQTSHFHRALERLRPPDMLPSEKAAEAVVKVLGL